VAQIAETRLNFADPLSQDCRFQAIAAIDIVLGLISRRPPKLPLFGENCPIPAVAIVGAANCRRSPSGWEVDSSAGSWAEGESGFGEAYLVENFAPRSDPPLQTPGTLINRRKFLRFSSILFCYQAGLPPAPAGSALACCS
jgi:hypothetical protein